MPDYKAMYLALFRRTEAARAALEQAEREAEAAFLESPEPPLRLGPEPAPAHETGPHAAP